MDKIDNEIKSKSIFITGGAGYIGSHLVDRLVGMNKVTVYDNLSSGKIEFIKQHFGKGNFNFIQCDLLNFVKLKKTIKGHDVIFHLAANPEARAGIENTKLDLEQETIATYNILEAMRLNNIRQIAFSSSGCIYGETPVIPLPEDYAPLLPISLYGAAKLACEALISAFCHIFKMQGWIFRFANIVGPRATHGVIFDLVNKLKKNRWELGVLGDGTQEKPYLHVQECIDGMIFGFNNSNSWINVFNLGCDSSTDVRTIAEMVVGEMGIKNVQIKYKGGERGWPGDVPQVRFSTERINKLGWKASMTSNEAVARGVKEIVNELMGK